MKNSVFILLGDEFVYCCSSFSQYCHHFSLFFFCLFFYLFFSLFYFAVFLRFSWGFRTVFRTFRLFSFNFLSFLIFFWLRGFSICFRVVSCYSSFSSFIFFFFLFFFCFILFRFFLLRFFLDFFCHFELLRYIYYLF